MASDNSVLIPFKSKRRRVKKSWIDYNGHMNVAYYTFAFDEAIDEFLEKIVGVGPSFIRELKQGSYALQTQYRYLNELFVGDPFFIMIFVADFTRKQMHLMAQMISSANQEVCATCETVMVNVDLQKRRSCEYPQAALENISKLHAASQEFRHSISIGHPIGLKKRTKQ